MAAEPQLVRVQENGEVTLPVEVRRRLGIKTGDLVAVVETAEGVLIAPSDVAAARALDQMGAILRERGLSLDEWIEAGRAEREDLLRELYGIEPDARSE